ncbi:MAG: signal recognition particle protein [Candidatus Korarchaeota archaeon]|nr:signal recognition particle protein [Candidatus Korarchaeota archaeon]NIU83817.1 signal recognition particle protein [Candidatus Thorarchaeota archaeon]NIW15231.1 signal recognition particle protein [Candidatus Thorarchaeota archaeon]NIW53208.1 signal recognition particle protein [Candidatus Korarchaeota archaeon]
MIGGLQSSLSKLWARIKGESYIDKEKLENIIREFQKALIEADVQVDLAKELSQKIKEDVLSKELPEGVPLNNFVLKKLYDELVTLLGTRGEDLNVKPGEQSTILFVGLQGSGKTTSVAKVANYLKKRGYHVATICADTYRPGAYDQLQQLTDKINVKCYGKKDGENTIQVIREGLKEYEGYDVVLVDTAGRHKEEAALIKEMKQLYREVTPSEVVLVIDGMIGQRAYDQAKAFANAIPIGSLLVTKMDSAAKGGGALAAAAATDAPIKFIGTGEDLKDIESYVPKRFVARLLGMPDVRVLEELSKEISESIKISDLTLEDMLEYFNSMGGGFLRRLKGSIPGVRNVPKNLIESRLEHQKAILKSMTKKELRNASLIEEERSRIKRIALGSGTSIKSVRTLLRQYKNLKKLTKTLMKQRNLKKEEALSRLMEGKVDEQLLQRIGAP